MGNPKRTKEEERERRRLAARQRRAQIKNDPVLYQQSKQKEKERYIQRKRDKKLLSVRELSPKIRKMTQKRNRENFKAYYKRKKEKKKSETIVEEMVVNPDELGANIKDPLETLSPPVRLNDLSFSLRSKNHTKTGFLPNCSENSISKKDDDQRDMICQQSTFFKEEEISLKKEPNSKPTVTTILCPSSALSSFSTDNTSLRDEIYQQSTSFKREEIPLKTEPNSIPPLITSSLRSSSSLSSSSSSDSMLLLDNNEQMTDNTDTIMNTKEQASSMCSTPTSPSSEIIVNKPKRKIISQLLSLKRQVYEANKEMSYMRKKIEELRRGKEKYRKQVIRLKYKNRLHIQNQNRLQKEKEAK